MSNSTYKTIHVPCEIGDVVYINIPGIRIPARRVITEICITKNNMFITGTNIRTGENTTWTASDFGKIVFTDIKMAENAKAADTEK